MPRAKTGKKILIATLSEIMTNPEASVQEKLEACRILAGLQKTAIKTKETPVKHSKSTLLV